MNETVTSTAETTQTLSGEEQPMTDVKAHSKLVEPTGAKTDVEKVIVAVHGIGDQNAYGTLQQVVNQFCSYYHQPAAIPLGSFHTVGQVAFSIPPPFPPEQFKEFAFAEVYWAKIPQKVVSNQHTLEEAKAWATTIVERLRLRWNQVQQDHAQAVKKSGKSPEKKPDHVQQTKTRGEDILLDLTEADFPRIQVILTELIESMAILERLSFLADKAGLFTFDLKKLLDDYLGDVQVVAEFATDRRKILDKFKDVVNAVHETYPQADIHIIAHSEGTVITLLGLLEAANQPEEAPWLNKVKGLMTFGSPIDKHLILWPELFPTHQASKRKIKDQPIEWRNYYDRGDPIGFELDFARDWLKENNWQGLFKFGHEDDFGFIRYPFPGEAHIEYWKDEHVFGHFIQTVIKPTAALNGVPPNPRYNAPPQDFKWYKIFSYTLPYVALFILLFIAVFILFKSVFGLDTSVEGANGDAFVFKNVLANTILLAGITVASRIPRLTWSLRLLGVALVTYSVAIISYLQLLPPEVKIETWFFNHFTSITNSLPTWLHGADLFRIFLATSIVIIVNVVHWKWPSVGITPLLVLASVLIVFIVYAYMNDDPQNHAARIPIWPVFIAAAAFFYLWWLVALIFDLVFVWHVHIRQSLALLKMKSIDKMGSIYDRSDS